VLPNTRLPLNLTLRVLSYNIDVLKLRCYDLRLKVFLSSRTTLVLSNTRELDRVPNTK